MTMLTPQRFVKSMKRSAALLQYTLQDIPQATAQAATDGPDGWSVLEILCHLRDFDQFFFYRARLMLEQENPQLPAYDHEFLAKERRYAEQNLQEVLAEFQAHRAEFVAWFISRTPEEWQRPGIHPENGAITILEQAVQISTHDVDHLEQIVRALTEYQARVR